MEATVQSLLECPGTGRQREFRWPRAQGLRSRVVKDFQAYMVFYRVVDDDLGIVRILHGARDIVGLFEGEG